MTKPTPADPALDAAREIAREVVRERFPELDGVEPKVSQRHALSPHPGDARRLGVASTASRAAHAAEYTFTFTREVRTPEGYTLPRVARITVDSQQRVIKTIMSK